MNKPLEGKDINNAGGHWVDRELCHEGGLITSRKPDDLDAMVVINYQEQLQPGTFEHAVHYLIEHKLGLSVFHPKVPQRRHRPHGLRSLHTPSRHK